MYMGKGCPGPEVEVFRLHKDPVESTLYFFLVGVIVAALLRLSRLYWGNRLRKWTAMRGLSLIDFRGAPFWEGPREWVRSQYQFLFRVEVEDKEGQRRRGWVTFGSLWRPRFACPSPEVEWDEPWYYLISV
jgi:hypothetical protein